MRSFLFVPADAPRKIEKALNGEADALILDLEDSVAPDNKAAAREVLHETIGALSEPQRRSSPPLFVRVNSLDTGLTRDDLLAVLKWRPAGVFQPKTRSASDVQVLSSMLDEIEDAYAVAGGSTGIHVIATETAASLFHMATYVDAGARLNGLTWGAEDLSADLGASSNRDEAGHYTGPYQLARTLCLLSAVAANVEPMDTVYVNFRDDDGLRQECAEAVRDGFTCKMAIHPAQVPAINKLFTPHPEAIARAQLIVDTFRAAGDPGVIGLDGEMLDRPHLIRAQRLLARAAVYGGSA